MKRDIITELSRLISGEYPSTGPSLYNVSNPFGSSSLSFVDLVDPLIENVFCPTGEGGGQDNSCSGKEGGGPHKGGIRPHEKEIHIAISALHSGEPEVAKKMLAGEKIPGWDNRDLEAIDKYRRQYRAKKEDGWDHLPEARYWKGKLVVGDGSHRVIAAIMEGASVIRFSFDTRTKPV